MANLFDIPGIIRDVQIVLDEVIPVIAIAALLSDGKLEPDEADRLTGLLKEVIDPLPINEAIKAALENPAVLTFIAKALLALVPQKPEGAV